MYDYIGFINLLVILRCFMKKQVIVVGGLGSGEIAYATFMALGEENEDWEVMGMLSDISQDELEHIPIIGKTRQIQDFIDAGYHIHYTLHFNAKLKEKRIEKLKQLSIPDEKNATGIHPDNKISKSTKIGYGVCTAPGVSTSPGVTIGNYCHLYSGCFIGHDTKLGDGVTVAAHAVVGGRVEVGDGAHIGLNSTIREDLCIGKYSILGAGSMLTKDIPEKEIWAGNPAKFLKMVGE